MPPFLRAHDSVYRVHMKKGWLKASSYSLFNSTIRSKSVVLTLHAHGTISSSTNLMADLHKLRIKWGAFLKFSELKTLFFSFDQYTRQLHRIFLSSQRSAFLGAVEMTEDQGLIPSNHKGQFTTLVSGYWMPPLASAGTSCM